MKHFCFFVLCLFISCQLLGQGNATQDKITLNTGEVYIGEIVVKTADMVMIKTKTGARYQFQLSEVKKIEKVAVGEAKPEPVTENSEIVSDGNFGGIAELSLGFSNARYVSDWSPNAQLSLVFGNKKFLNKDLFLGFGIGYNSTFTTNQKVLNIVPLFIRIQHTLSKKRIAPYVGFDAGYAMSVNSTYTGGVTFKVFAGLAQKISYKSTLYTGVYAGVNTIKGALTEKNELGTYVYQGQTTMNNIGLKIGLQF